MTDQEFDVLDELYFVYSYDHVKSELGWEDGLLKKVLSDLLEKGWVKCFKSVHEELLPEELEFDHDYNKYLYLATKAGLFAHNGR